MDKFAEDVKKVLLSTPQIERLKKRFIKKWHLYTYCVNCPEFNIEEHFDIISKPMKLQSDLDEFLSKIMSEKLPDDKPRYFIIFC